MADIAEYGVRIKAPEGVDASVAGFKKIEDASKKTTAAVDKHEGAFARSSAAMSKHNAMAMSALRMLGPLGTGAFEVGERFERAAIRAERLGETASRAASQQKILEKAHRDGAIAAATMEAATTKLTAARQAAAAVEQAYARAQAASRVAQEEARIASANLREQKAVVAGVGPVTGMGLREAQQLEAAQRRLNQAQGEAALTTNTYKAAIAEERALKLELAAANKEAASAQELMNVATKASGPGFGATIAIVAALVAVLIGLAAAFEGVKTGWEFVKESFKAASGVESAAVSLKLLINNATAAHKIFEDLNQLDLDTGVGEKALLGTATQLYAIGIGVDDLSEKTKQLANVAAVLNQPIDGITSSYIRMFEMIGATGKVQTRALTQFAQQGFDVLLVLSQATGKTREEVARMVKDGQVGIREIDAALAAFAKNDFLTARAGTWEGLGKRVAAAWEEVHEVFGRPIIDALEPILDDLMKNLPAVIAFAADLGEKIGHVVRAFALVAKETDWQTAVIAAWEYVILAMGKATIDILADTFKRLGPILRTALIAGLTGGSMAFMTEFVAQFAAEFGSKMADAQGRMQAALDRTAPTTASRGVADAADLSRPDLRRKTKTPSTGDMSGGQSDWEKYKTDLQIINDYWEEYNLIQSKAQSETERTRRVIELETKTAKALSDPAAYAKDFTTIQGKWEAMEEARIRKANETDAAIKSGNASVTDSFLRGIEKATESWGNFQTKVAKFAEDAVNRIGDGFATALGDIVTGTKDAKTAFRDMAVSILQDISRMIIKMLVLQAIQMALGYFGGGGGGGAAGGVSSAANAVGGAKFGGYGAGGAIDGPSHAGGGVFINAEGGEYMIRKDAVRNEGMEKMDMLNRGRATIVKKYGDGGEVVSGGSHYGTNPRGMNPPWHFDPYGSAADYDVWRGNLNTRFRSDTSAPSYQPLGDVDLPPIGEDPTIMTPPVPRPDPVRPPRPGPNYGLPRDPGAGLDGPGLFGGGPQSGGGPTVQVNWIGNGSVPFWNQPPTQVGPGNISLGAQLAGNYNSSLGTWDTIDAAGNLTRVPVPAPSSFGSGLTAAGLNVVGYDANTGTTFYQDASGNTYASGASSPRETQPGGATGNQPGGPAGTGVAPYSNFGGVTTGQRSTVGNAAFDSHAAGLMEMAFQSFGGNPNFVPNDRERMAVYYAGGQFMGHAEDGVVSNVRRPDYGNDPPPKIAWNMPSQEESARLGLSYSDRAHVEALNTWLQTHNVENYAKLREWQARHPGGAAGLPTATFSSQPTFTGPTNTGPELPTFHGGGIVGERYAYMAEGGPVNQPIMAQRGEGVFTRGQMAAIGAGMSQGQQKVEVNINVDSHDVVSATASGDTGLSPEEWKRIGTLVSSIVQAKLAENKRYRGELYQPRNGR